MKCSNRNARITNFIVSAAIALAAVVAGTQFGALLSGQSSTNGPSAFEVASIRPAVHGAGEEGSTRSQIETAGDGLTMRNVDLREMVQWAYGLEDYQVQGAHMLEGLRYDIRARAGDRESVSTLRLMLQDLLA